MKLAMFDKAFEILGRNRAVEYNGERTELERALRAIGPQPAYSALIGMCEDGLPLLFGLDEPVLGSLLIIGQAGCGRRALLRTILSSASLLSEAHMVRWGLISANPMLASQALVQERAQMVFCEPPYTGLAGSLIRDWAATAHQRETGREIGPALILAIDELADLAPHLDFEDGRALAWLVEHGPQAGVWVIATLEAGQEQEVDRRLIARFPTQILGQGAGQFATRDGKTQVMFRAVG